MAFNPKAGILVVDDDDLIRDVVCLMLSTLGFATISAKDAVEALDCMNNNDSIHFVRIPLKLTSHSGGY